MADVPAGEAFFLAVRDPVSRFISGFYSRQRMGRPRYNVEWSEGERAAFTRFETANQLAEAIGDPHADAAMRAIRHVNSYQQNWIVGKELVERRRPDLIAVMYAETLTEDFARLLPKLGLRNVHLPLDDIGAHRSPSGVDKQISDTGRANLESWYRQDYELLGWLEQFR